jgi:hypothetical protein
MLARSEAGGLTQGMTSFGELRITDTMHGSALVLSEVSDRHRLCHGAFAWLPIP